MLNTVDSGRERRSMVEPEGVELESSVFDRDLVPRSRDLFGLVCGVSCCAL